MAGAAKTLLSYVNNPLTIRKSIRFKKICINPNEKTIEEGRSRKGDRGRAIVSIVVIIIIRRTFFPFDRVCRHILLHLSKRGLLRPSFCPSFRPPSFRPPVGSLLSNSVSPIFAASSPPLLLPGPDTDRRPGASGPRERELAIFILYDFQRKPLKS